MKKQTPDVLRILTILCCLLLVLTGCRSVEDDSSGVSVATIKVSPSDTTMETGEVLQLTAAKLYTDSSTTDCSAEASWSSSDTAVASFSATTNGLLSAVAAGTTTIQVSCGGTSKSYTMTVTGAATLQSIEVSPNERTIVNSTKLILIATGIYSDGSIVDLTDSVGWSSSDSSNVLVERSNGSNSIQAGAVTAGASETITAQYGDISGTTTINVAAAGVTASELTVTPVNPTLAVDARLYLKAAMRYSNDSVQEVTDFMSWSSSDSTTATVSNVNNGYTDGIAAGTATITADDGAGTTGTTTVTVGSATLDYIEIYPPAPSMNIGTTLQFQAIGVYSDNTTIDLTDQVSWRSSNTDLLTVTSSHRHHPRAQAVAEGTAFLSASLPGTTEGNSAVITITDLTLSSIEVTPANPTIPANLDMQFNATGVFSDDSKQDLTDSVVWSSSDASVIKINNAFQIAGRARSKTAGSATITATLGSKSGTASATVSSATLSTVEITPSGLELPDGYRKPMTATGIYSDNSRHDLTSLIEWKTDNSNVIMENIPPWQGVIAATTSGLTGVKVTGTFFGMDGQETAAIGFTTINTTSATLSSIEVSPTEPFCVAGLDKQFTATGVFSDTTTLDLTPFVLWKSSDTSVATPNNVPETKGLFRCASSGSVTVTAASGSTSGTTTLFVADQ